jgi:hypothetical protein
MELCELPSIANRGDYKNERPIHRGESRDGKLTTRRRGAAPASRPPAAKSLACSLDSCSAVGHATGP